MAVVGVVADIEDAMLLMDARTGTVLLRGEGPGCVEAADIKGTNAMELGSS